MIYVTLGTMFLDFPRLIHAVDDIAHARGERCVMQLGLSPTRPQHAEWFDYRPHEALLALQAEARVIVAHAGIGVTRDALRVRRPLILVPRLRRYREHMNDHQIDIARAVAQRGWGAMVHDTAELPALIAAPPAPPAQYAPTRGPLLDAVRDFVAAVAEGRAACR